MKTVLAALVSVVALSAPAFASEPTLSLRGTEKVASAQASAKADPAPTRIAEAAPGRTVRVVLASPYGK